MTSAFVRVQNLYFKIQVFWDMKHLGPLDSEDERIIEFRKACDSINITFL